MKIQRMEERHIDDCLCLLEAQYRKERKSVPALPSFARYRTIVRSRLERLAKRAGAWVLTEGGRPTAMMGGYRVSEFFGTDDGAFVPAYAHLHAVPAKADAISDLYAHCAEHWVRDGMTSHAVNVFAHDRTALDCYYRLGFGMRCVDSIRGTARLLEGPVSFKVHQVDRTTVGKLAEIHLQHGLYYRQSPMFMPTADEDPVQDLLEWMEQPDRYIFAYFEGDNCLGYIRLQPEGESLFSSHPSMMNVSALFVAPEARKRSIGAILLDRTQAFLADAGRDLTGVDFESINPAGARFWNRHFVPFSYSLTRRIDERVMKLSEQYDEARPIPAFPS